MPALAGGYSGSGRPGGDYRETAGVEAFSNRRPAGVGLTPPPGRQENVLERRVRPVPAAGYYGRNLRGMAR